jgi:voltage-gated potassium channel
MEIGSRNPIWTALILLLGVITTGTCGYMILEGYNVLEGLYMTIITVTTVGFGEVRPLSDLGRGFTTLLILIGFGALAFVGHSLAESLFVNISSGKSEINRMKKIISQLESHYIICGFGRVGASAVDHFIEAEVPFVIIEANPKTIKETRQEGYNVIEGDATHEDLLLEAGIKSASGVLALLDSDPDNLFIVLTARELNPVLHIIARVEETSSEKKVIRAGADSVISPFAAAGNQIACNILTATGRMREHIDQTAVSGVGPQWITVREDSGLENSTLKEASIQLGVEVIGLRSDCRDVMMPDPGIRLKKSDKILTKKGKQNTVGDLRRRAPGPRKSDRR